MPTLTVHQFPSRREHAKLHVEHWALLGFAAALPLGCLCLLGALRPDLMNEVPAVVISLQLAAVPVTFLAQLLGFMACNALNPPRWPLAFITFVAWVVPFVTFTLPTLWSIMFMPIVWAFMLSRASG